MCRCGAVHNAVSRPDPLRQPGLIGPLRSSADAPLVTDWSQEVAQRVFVAVTRGQPTTSHLRRSEAEFVWPGQSRIVAENGLNGVRIPGGAPASQKRVGQSLETRCGCTCTVSIFSTGVRRESGIPRASSWRCYRDGDQHWRHPIPKSPHRAVGRSSVDAPTCRLNDPNVSISPGAL